MVTPITGLELARKLVKIFNLPDNVQRIIIDVKVNDVVKVYAQMVGDKVEMALAIEEIEKSMPKPLIDP